MRKSPYVKGPKMAPFKSTKTSSKVKPQGDWGDSIEDFEQKWNYERQQYRYWSGYDFRN